MSGNASLLQKDKIAMDDPSIAIDAGMAGIGTGLLCFLPMLLIGLATTVFWVWMLVDCLTKESSEGNDKLVWAAVIFFLHLLGAVLYYFVRRPKRIEELGQ